MELTKQSNNNIATSNPLRLRPPPSAPANNHTQHNQHPPAAAGDGVRSPGLHGGPPGPPANGHHGPPPPGHHGPPPPPGSNGPAGPGNSNEHVQAQIALAMRGITGNPAGRRRGNFMGAIAATGNTILMTLQTKNNYSLKGIKVLFTTLSKSFKTKYLKATNGFSLDLNKRL